MPGKIFINYRRDDARDMTARVRDRLAGVFGAASIFMDVDNLLAGQRFDKELDKALGETDVFLAAIGPRWMELFAQRQASGERDYVREEIAAALKRGVLVIPVLIERAPLPRGADLPDDIREMVLHQKHDVGYERFGRDIEELVVAIRAGRKVMQAEARTPSPIQAVPWGWIGASVAGTLAIAYAGAYNAGVPLPWPWSPPAVVAKGPDAAAEVKSRADELERLRVAAATSEAEAARLRADAEVRRKADEAERQKEAAEQKRLAALKVEEDRQRAAAAQREREAAEAKKKAEEETKARAAAAETKRLADLAAAEERRKAQEMRPGRVFRDCNDGCPEMVVVAAGRFKMGEGSSARDVTIQQPFAVGKFEVTFAEWEACVAGGGCTSNRSPSDQGWGKGRRPVINVSWNDAKEYVSWISRKTGKIYRLLTEAEWEYAARAGSSTTYSWGDAIGRGNANCDGCGSQWDNKQTAPVGSFKPNDFGLHDMHGNVWEWCEDAYGSSSRVLRGGSWYGGPNYLRSAVRSNDLPDNRYYSIGFRLARTL